MTGLLLYASAAMRRLLRRPVHYGGKLASDDVNVERRRLIARLGQQVADHLLYYPQDIGVEAIQAAEWILTGGATLHVRATVENTTMPEYRERPIGQPSAILRLWWALAALGACLAGLGYLVHGRA